LLTAAIPIILHRTLGLQPTRVGPMCSVAADSVVSSVVTTGRYARSPGWRSRAVGQGW
jgi:hypothetical protein